MRRSAHSTTDSEWLAAWLKVYGAVRGPRNPAEGCARCHKVVIAYCLLRSLVEHSCINSKSLAFGYLNEKSIDTGLIKFLSLYPSALSWYLEFAFAFSTFSAPFTTNALSL
ncbi:hypothetical protein GW17_00043106 [Ensete ventricosum]|uniref:Uncharacterized protein n=1 Tax=Ensete ventricosum TaxID=4639 RepID=A0A444D870_ENSVE|nr:hypothetical protein GW17_00043106 [Ensete ventricosum]RZR72493.1 hypothetical protein BHM03_00014083 [Ensete ventricosum]